MILGYILLDLRIENLGYTLYELNILAEMVEKRCDVSSHINHFISFFLIGRSSLPNYEGKGQTVKKSSNAR